MVKIHVDWEAMIDIPTLKEKFEVEPSPEKADLIIYQSTDRTPYQIDFKKKIYLAVEPPGANDHRNWCYAHFKDYFCVAAFDPKGLNEIPLTTEPEKFPLGWWGDEYPCKEREITEVNKAVYWAGHVFNDRLNSLEAHGAENMAHIRYPLYETLSQAFPESEFHIPNLGIGLIANPFYPASENWRVEKIKEIERSKADFVLAVEHVRYPNYISEKLFDGMIADRVPLFLGEPTIEKFVPTNCFVDLRQFYRDKVFHYDELVEFIKKMTKEEYMEYLKNIRVFRKTLFNQQARLKIELTKRVMKYIEENYHG